MKGGLGCDYRVSLPFLMSIRSNFVRTLTDKTSTVLVSSIDGNKKIEYVRVRVPTNYLSPGFVSITSLYL